MSAEINPEGILKLIVVFVYAVILHEFAHGWVAYKLGDPTAKSLGRLTLNPLKHVDPFGTVILPVMLRVMNSPVIFGWAKPVPVNFMNLRHPKRDMALVGLAGPAINIVMAYVFSRCLQLNLASLDRQILETGIFINLVLAVFNMIPIPPLDGSRLVMSLLPNRYLFYYGRLENYGIFIVLLLLYAGLFDALVWPTVYFLAGLLGIPS